jgi:hypothetical protein
MITTAMPKGLHAYTQTLIIVRTIGTFRGIKKIDDFSMKKHFLFNTCTCQFSLLWWVSFSFSFRKKYFHSFVVAKKNNFSKYHQPTTQQQLYHPVVVEQVFSANNFSKFSFQDNPAKYSYCERKNRKKSILLLNKSVERNFLKSIHTFSSPDMMVWSTCYDTPDTKVNYYFFFILITFCS